MITDHSSKAKLSTYGVLTLGAIGVVLVGTGLGGCSSSSSSEPVKVFKSKSGHDHDHVRSDAMLEDIILPDGTKGHAGLTAHLDPAGNELDVFFESLDKEPQPLSLPQTAQVTARVTRAGDDQAYQLTFQPAPQAERPRDPPGRCSRFSAAAPWMRPDDKLTVVVSIELDGQLKRVTFVDFVPSKFAHHHSADPIKDPTPNNSSLNRQQDKGRSEK
ncbi:MAG: hypothetical protein NZ703_13075 [Gemmataceae bacterium]|nr:hypothetical protein [Gemmataceae bacterium]MCS7272006.1 hypothetical protein [Gemmataceae bacterium]MDW8243757.1 hypothetical protein [Thermogemmata sp.]